MELGNLEVFLLEDARHRWVRVLADQKAQTIAGGFLECQAHALGAEVRRDRYLSFLLTPVDQVARSFRVVVVLGITGTAILLEVVLVLGARVLLVLRLLPVLGPELGPEGTELVDLRLLRLGKFTPELVDGLLLRIRRLLLLLRVPLPIFVSCRKGLVAPRERLQPLLLLRLALIRPILRSDDVEEGLISSCPMRNSGGEFGIVQDVPIDDFSRAKIDATVNELKEEKSMVADLLPG